MADDTGDGWAAGLTVCTTGLPGAQRQEVASEVAAAGGRCARATGVGNRQGAWQAAGQADASAGRPT